MVAAHPVLALQFLSKPSACGDSVQAESIGIVGEDAICADGKEPGLEVLNEIELRDVSACVTYGIGGRPGRCEERIALAMSGEVALQGGTHRRVVIPQDLSRPTGSLRLVGIVDIDAARIAASFEEPHEPKYVQVPARSRADRRDNPADYFGIGATPRGVCCL